MPYDDNWGSDDKVITQPPKSDPGFLEPGSQSEAILRAISNSGTFGVAPRASAAISTGLGKIMPETFGNESYSKRLQDYLDADKAASEAYPKTTFAAGLAPSLLQAAATGGGSLARQAATNTALGAINSAGNAAPGQVGTEALTGGATAGALSMLPAGLNKAAEAAKKYTSNAVSKTVEDLIKNKPTGWKDKLADYYNTPKNKLLEDLEAKNFTEAGNTLVDSIKKSGEPFIKGDPGFVQLSDQSDLSKKLIRDTIPSMKDIASNTYKAGRDAALGAGAVGAINYAAGSPIDPAQAMITAAGLSSVGGMKDLGMNVVNKSIMSVGSSAIPEAMSSWASKNPKLSTGLTQFGAQTAASETQNTDNSGGFKRLTDFLSGMKDEDKRKQAMNLSASPEGRSFGNDDSPVSNSNTSTNDDWGNDDQLVK